jgi:hypothetical protein
MIEIRKLYRKPDGCITILAAVGTSQKRMAEYFVEVEQRLDLFKYAVTEQRRDKSGIFFVTWPADIDISLTPTHIEVVW